MIRFAKLCHTVTTGRFAENAKRPLGTKTPPPKAFVYFHPVNRVAGQHLERMIAFFATAAPEVAAEVEGKKKPRPGFVGKKGVRAVVAELRQRMICLNLPHLRLQPQNGRYPVGYCAESLAFAA